MAAWLGHLQGSALEHLKASLNSSRWRNMKRSEMLKIIATAYAHTCDHYNLNPYENAEILLTLIEGSGMLPPSCSEYYIYGEPLNEWEDEDENTIRRLKKEKQI
jgi:hypothetical protein